MFWEKKKEIGVMQEVGYQKVQNMGFR